MHACVIVATTIFIRLLLLLSLEKYDDMHYTHSIMMQRGIICLSAFFYLSSSCSRDQPSFRYNPHFLHQIHENASPSLRISLPFPTPITAA